MNELVAEISGYAQAINAGDEVLSWIHTTLLAHERKAFEKLRPTSLESLEHIIDYLVSDKAPKRLKKMSFVDAKRKALEWSEANQKKGRNLTDSDEDIEVIHDFLDGNKIVKLKTAKAYKREGFFMRHCVGGYSVNENVHIYSLRDSKNEPHATFEVQKSNNEIVQIKGKGNGEIHPKYIHSILAFLKTIGMDIRPNDMANLGYHHIPKSQLEIINKFNVKEQITMISGEAYAH